MPQSTVTEKGQTTVPAQVRKAMNLTPHQKIQWDIQPEWFGSGTLSQSSALDLFGSLKPNKAFPGLREEKDAVRGEIARNAAKKGDR